MKNISFYVLILVLGLIGGLSGCTDRFLDINSDKSTVVPNSLEDYMMLLSFSSVMNRSSSHELAIIGSDEYYVTDEQWRLLTDPSQKNGYIWADDIYEMTEGNDWSRAYFRILYANQALDGIEAISPVGPEKELWNQIKGTGLFFRALNFYQLAQLFCKPYNPTTAADDLGIPIRLEADITLPSARGTLQETYSQIIRDLEVACGLLSEQVVNQYTPSLPAAYALLAKTYLHMEDYSNAARYADSTLQLRNGLNDFNGLDVTLRYSFPSNGENNAEVIFYSSVAGLPIVGSRSCDTDTVLLNLYEDNDLRRGVYYYQNPDGRILFKGSYTGSALPFTGLTTGETLLIRAEAYTRLGHLNLADADLNRLRKKRYSNYIPLYLTGQDDMLEAILDERRKELVMRGTRWEDLRRLNKEERFATSVTRNVNNEQYVLEPLDEKWVWPIPSKEVDLNGLIQNPR